MVRLNKLGSINLSHGSGGKAMQDLIQDLFVYHFNNEYLSTLEDQARFNLSDLSQYGDRLSVTTDSFVVDPLFFPGGDIGKLAVCGTVNDLVVGGAKPLYLTCSFIIEEGLPIEVLESVVLSMKQTAEQAGVYIVTGDTKVVGKGHADKLFINTTGVGVIPANINISCKRLQPTDVVICNGYIGDHGAAIVDARGELELETTIESDCAPLNDLVNEIISVCPNIRAMRDATRGGVATVLNEFASASNCRIVIEEEQLPIRNDVRGICELLGLDPLYLANEGKIVFVAPKDEAERILKRMKTHPLGHNSNVIGYVEKSERADVVMNTSFGSQRYVDVLIGDQLPRIC